MVMPGMSADEQRRAARLVRLASLERLIAERTVLHPEGLSYEETTAKHAHRHGVTVQTARDDLAAILGGGKIVVTGIGKRRRVNVVGGTPEPPAPTPAAPQRTSEETL